MLTVLISIYPNTQQLNLYQLIIRLLNNNELTIETNQSEEIYLELPKILQKEKITVEKIYSEDDSLDSLYTKLVEGAQWR